MNEIIIVMLIFICLVLIKQNAEFSKKISSLKSGRYFMRKVMNENGLIPKEFVKYE